MCIYIYICKKDWKASKQAGMWYYVYIYIYYYRPDPSRNVHTKKDLGQRDTETPETPDLRIWTNTKKIGCAQGTPVCDIKRCTFLRRIAQLGNLKKT